MIPASAALQGGRLRAWARPLVSAMLGILVRRTRRGAAPGSPPRILILSYEPQLGSVMAMTPMLGALRQAAPGAEITVAGTELHAETLRHCPHIDRLAGTPYPCSTWTTMVRACLSALAYPEFRFDWLITTEGNRHHVRTGVLAACLPARRRDGLAASTVLAHYDHPVPFDTEASMVVNNLQALAPFGVAPSPREPEIFFDGAALGRVQGWLVEAGIDLDRPLGVMTPETSGRQPVRWPPDRMAAVADRLSAKHGVQWVLVGTAPGSALIDAVRTRMKSPAPSFAGRTTVPELAALFALADIAVLPDTGALHVARGTGVPIAMVASGWQPPHHWLPLGVESCTIVSRRDLCAPSCRKGICLSGACMAAIDADAVVEAASRLLERFPPLSGRKARVARHCVAPAQPQPRHLASFREVTA